MVSIRIIIYLLILLTLAVFWQVLDFDFVNYDDDNYIYFNPHIQKGLSGRGIRWAFQADLVFDSVNADYWQPVTFLSRMLDVQLWKLRPAGHHLTNLLLHIANVILLFLILLSMTGSLWKSAWVAGIFAIHPLVIDSVAWVTARKDLLSTFFGFLSLGFYVRGARNPSLKRYLLIAFLFCLSLMSKPTWLVLPLLFLLLDDWPLGRLEFRKVFREKWLLGLIALGFYVLFLTSHSRGVSLVLRRTDVWTWPVFYLRYLWKAIWPVSLATLYPPDPPWTFWQVAGAMSLFLAVSIFSMLNRRRSPYLWVGWLWFLITLFPAVGSSQDNRFMYVPLIGLALMGWGIPEFLRRLAVPRWALAVMAISPLFLYGLGSWFQLGRWQNSITLFEHDLRVTQRNAPAHAALAHALQKRGNIDEAVWNYREALRMDPAHLSSHHCLGQVLESQGKIDEAILHYHEALKVNSNIAQIHNSLGGALVRQGKFDEALQAYQRAVEISPDYFEAYNNLGVTMSVMGRFPEAVSYFEKALRLDPENRSTRLNWARALKALPQTN